MTDDLVKRLRLQAGTSLMRLPLDHVYVSHGEAADRIEELQKKVKQYEYWVVEIRRWIETGEIPR